MSDSEEKKEEAVEKPAPLPDWYTQDSWLKATVDLKAGGWGTITLEEPTGPKADAYWDVVRGFAGKEQEEIDAGSVGKIEVSKLSIYVSGGSDERIPTDRYDKKAWNTCYALMPKRVSTRITDAIELFAASEEAEGNSSGGNSAPS